MAVANADTESLPHYDVEVTPISSQPEIKYELLKKATVDALNKFQTDCSANLPAEFTKYLDALMTEIDSTHKAHEMHVVKASATTSTDTSGINPNKRKLHNFGNTCYMNSVLQLIYSMNAFKEEVLKINHDDPLKKYLSKMENGVTNTEENRKLLENLIQFLNLNFKIGTQQDAEEVLTSILGNDEYKSIIPKIQYSLGQSVFFENKQTIPDGCRKINNDTQAKILKFFSRDKNIVNAFIYISDNNLSNIFNLSIPANLKDVTFKNVFDAFFEPTERWDNTTKDDSNNLNSLNDENGFIYSLPESVVVKDDKPKSKVKKVKEECKSLVENQTFDSLKNNIKNKSYVFPGDNQQYFIVLLKRYDNTGKKISTSIDLTNAEITFDNSTTFKIKGCICHLGDDPKEGHYTYVEFNDGKPTTVYNDDKDILQYDNYIKIDANKGNTVDVTGYVLLFEKQEQNQP